MQDPQDPQVLMIKAQALYDKSLFEHSFIYFSRSVRYSPTSEKAREGVKKCIRTIKNSLANDVFKASKSAKFLKQISSTHNNQYLSENKSSEKMQGKEKRNYKYVSILQEEHKYFSQLKKSFSKIRLQNNRNQESLMNLLSKTEDFLENRTEFWYQF